MMTEYLTSENVFKIIDILLKITLGVIVVIYINNRNNKTKKKEILYNLYIDLTKYAQKSYEYNKNYIKHNLIIRMRTNAYFDEDIPTLNLIKSLEKKSAKNLKNNKDASVNFYQTIEAIKLILGKLNIKDKELQLEVKCKEHIVLPNLWNEEKDTQIKIITDNIAEKIKFHSMGALYDHELEFMIDDAMNPYISVNTTNYLIEFNKNVLPFLNLVKKWIDKM